MSPFLDPSAANGHVPLASFRYLERTVPGLPGIRQLEAEIGARLSTLRIAPERLRNRRIAVSAGSRGIASLAKIVRGVCAWLRTQGAEPFVFPAMGTHGGGTAEGQSKILEDYGVRSDYVGAEIRSDMAAASLGETPEGFQAFMDRAAAEADGVVVVNRVKPHTDFSGKIESGLLKMMAVGMGKVEGARECHRWSRKFGHEKVIRAMSARVLGSGKILCGLAVVENELHQIAAVRAARPEHIVAQEEEALEVARPLVPRLPFSALDLLIVDELGKNISGAGMDTKIIGRGVELDPGEARQAPEIKLIYVRDLTPESAGNAIGIGLADVMHERLYRKIDREKMYLNARTSLNPPVARLPIALPSDREALDFALGALGSPAPEEQRVAWIRNTLDLGRVAISERLAREIDSRGVAGPAAELSGWRLAPDIYSPRFDAAGNLAMS